MVLIRVAGSVPKCHGSATLEKRQINNNKKTQLVTGRTGGGLPVQEVESCLRLPVVPGLLLLLLEAQLVRARPVRNGNEKYKHILRKYSYHFFS